jgi:uncharacterized protein
MTPSTQPKSWLPARRRSWGGKRLGPPSRCSKWEGGTGAKVDNVNTFRKYSMRFAWNAEKNRMNVKRHGIAFRDAARIFDGPTVEKVDDRFDYGEIRVYAIGLVNSIVITVIYTDRANDERHLISAWRSEPHERRSYWQNLEEKGV